MSLLIDIEESTTYRAYVRCETCEENHEGGSFKDSRAAAETSACDAAKADGWKVAGNSAICPDCDNAESNQEDVGDDNLPREAQERAAKSWRFKR